MGFVPEVGVTSTVAVTAAIALFATTLTLNWPRVRAALLELALPKPNSSLLPASQPLDVPATDEVREPGVVYLHTPYLRSWGFPNASPFSTKLETFLRMTNIKYRTIRGFNLNSAPKKKYPFIELDGARIGDSDLIIQLLVARFPLCGCSDSHLSPSEKATAFAFDRMICESFNFVTGYSRNYENFDYTLAAYTYGDVASLATPPPPRTLLQSLFAAIITRTIKKRTFAKLQAQGLGVHSRDEIYAIGNRCLQAVSDFLGDKEFLMGSTPSQVDASIFGILTSTLWIPVEFPCKTYAYENCPNLHKYLIRMRDRFYKDTLADTPWYVGGALAAKMELEPATTTDEK
ncbi:hypothetical protein HK100_002109 [Physocladia obscura]|uniref:Glutathione S-transferase n=1 Tax=Physocladia obscura TaxID=109957 RepID=A0AAD5XH85_9FUNG|nr:hypothetical protein HK100_002109 [Physocladia obscura]